MKTDYGSRFLQYWIPLQKILIKLGGSGTPSEITDMVIEELKIPEKEQAETIKSGTSKVRNEIAWARAYLAKAGFIDSSQRGIWSLTDKGLNTPLNKKDVENFHRQIVKEDRKKREDKRNKFEDVIGKDGKTEEEEPETQDYKKELLEILKSLSPNGFERICQRLLRESGFQQVTVTGRSSDGGIDGHGIFKMNPFVSFKVLFQCKRYQGSVSASQIRDFRGAMAGRADKGIVITTGSFTSEAGKEARRDGVHPIETVDGEKLVEMFARSELGLKPKRSYEIDYDFFEGYKK